VRFIRLLRYVLVGVAGLYLLAAVLYAVPVISGLFDDAMEVRFSRPDPSLVADYHNGLTPGQKETYYNLSQGSEIQPWDRPYCGPQDLLPDPGHRSARNPTQVLHRRGLAIS
jgi:hypothetical protein